MTERLLQFIWQMQYFNKGSLETTKQEPIEIITPGLVNTNQGPDFLDARIRIAKTTWAGSVELHLFTSGWEQHGHGGDPNFNNVILHVVWENDLDDHPLPLLELKDRVPKFLLQRYAELLRNPSFIPCETMIPSTDALIIDHWKDRLLVERIENKAAVICRMYEENRQNWQELYWWLLARNFGYAVNSEAFEAVARTLNMKLLSKHGKLIQQLEAMLLGQAGLLRGNFSEPYAMMLQKEYAFLKKKYSLEPIVHPVHFLRMRPANFPTIRLAQLAMLVHTGGHMLEHARDLAKPGDLRKIFDLSPNDYWQTHYLLDKPSPFRDKKIGEAMFSNILINTIAPFLYAYGKFHRNLNYTERALEWLTETPHERNSIISGFERVGMRIRNAADSQSMLELKNRYCDKKRCLDCNIGNAILRQ